MKTFKRSTRIAFLVIALMLTASAFAQTGTSNDQGAMTPNNTANTDQGTAMQGEPIMLVDPAKIYNDNLKAMTVHKGDVVTITGMVQAASRYKAAEATAASGSMHDAEKTSGVFVLADQLNVDSSTHR